jgi:hypothetical protein
LTIFSFSYHKHFQIGLKYPDHKFSQIRSFMACHMSITMHNLLPEKPSEGIHVPFHTIVMDPFRKPFTFGPERCDVKHGSHIGMESDAPVTATFVGTEGDFLVMSADQFVILRPKEGGHITVGATLFPKETTHEVHVAEKGRSYPITMGTAILAYHFDEMPGLSSITVFMGVNATANVYYAALGAMAQSLVYFNGIWKAIAHNKRCVSKEAFKPTEVSREKHADMRVIMNYTTQKPTSTPLNQMKPPMPRTEPPPAKKLKEG